MNASSSTPARRRWIRSAILGAAVPIAALVGAAVWIWSAAPQSNVGKLDFENALRIPPLAEPSVDEPGRKVIDLQLQEGRAEILPGNRTETWGVNGPHLGPTLRAERGDTVTVNVVNDLWRRGTAQPRDGDHSTMNHQD